MGLDVSLEERESVEQTAAHEKAWNALWERKEAGEITQQQFDAECRSLPTYGSAEDVPSEKYPEHLFNRRYLRSSYNSAGFNTAVPQFLGTGGLHGDGSLYWMFEEVFRDADGELDYDVYDFELGPDKIEALKIAKTRALDVVDRLGKVENPIRSTDVRADPLLGEFFSEDTALEEYRKQEAQNKILLAKDPERSKYFGEGYSYHAGHVFGFTGGLEVVAAYPGKDIIGQLCIHLVYRVPRETIDSYIQSAEITAEFCDEAIDIIQRTGAVFITWSG